MHDYLLLMHNDQPQRGEENSAEAWSTYLGHLQATGLFEGGSAMTGGVCVRKSGDVPPIAAHIGGYLRIKAESLEHAQSLLAGNPVYEAGGTIEIRKLPRTD